MTDQYGNSITNLQDYTVTVGVTNGTAWQGIAGADVLHVTVTVSHSEIPDMTLEAYRTRY